MLKRHGREIIYCILAPVITVLMLLVMVCIFEYLGIHVPGSREMWMGVIGAVIGGMFTLVGVLVTVYQQESADGENRRLGSLPILDFKVVYDNTSPDLILTVMPDNKLITSGFICLETKVCSKIVITTANDNCAFDICIEGMAINGKCVCLGNTFNPSKRRLTSAESTNIIFDCDMNTNIFCLLRISYDDLFGNKYYQDLPFVYFETANNEEKGRLRQVIEIRDIQAPILQKNAKSLEDSAKEYIDFEVFCR